MLHCIYSLRALYPTQKESQLTLTQGNSNEKTIPNHSRPNAVYYCWLCAAVESAADKAKTIAAHVKTLKTKGCDALPEAAQTLLVVLIKSRD